MPIPVRSGLARGTGGILTQASVATLTPDLDLHQQYELTAQAIPLTIGAPTGSAERMLIRLKDSGTARALTWNAVYRSMGAALPGTTVANKTTYLGFIRNSTDTRWDLVAISQEP